VTIHIHSAMQDANNFKLVTVIAEKNDMEVTCLDFSYHGDLEMGLC
jgi:hypothetical protein